MVKCFDELSKVELAKLCSNYMKSFGSGMFHQTGLYIKEYYAINGLT